MQQNRVKTTPIATPKSRRVEDKKILTSGKAGKVIPLAYIPFLREDGLRSGNMRFSFEMAETAETLMNGINIQVNAYFVSNLALARFSGEDALNRSYEGEPEIEGGSVTPFIETAPFGLHEANEIYTAMGLHAKPTDMVNTIIVEAYNAVYNYRLKNISKSLTPRLLTDTTLADAPWFHTSMKHIVPDFDQARIDGEVALTIVESNLPVKGIGNRDITPSAGVTGVYESGTVGAQTYPYGQATDAAGDVVIETDAAGVPAVFAEMVAGGITVSLATIDLAKKMATFARVMDQYQGHSEDYVVDLLTQGIRVPNSTMQEPILLAQENTTFVNVVQPATDGASLGDSVTTGGAFVDLRLRMPPMNMGGIIIITAEMTPEQLFERQKDYFLHAQGVGDFPNFRKDFLDPEKVAIVQNDHVDVDHTDPASTFGYAPLNHEWMRSAPNIGGKYYRPEVDASFDEDRQKIWAVETIDPILSEDFYICTAMHQKVFADTEADAFEILGRGKFEITGNTVFGPALVEASTTYDDISAEVDKTKIDKTA